MEHTHARDDFIRHLTGFQGKLYAYTLALLADPDAAADVVQETNVVLWHKADQFTPGTNFASWALHVAYTVSSFMPSCMAIFSADAKKLLPLPSQLVRDSVGQ